MMITAIVMQFSVGFRKARHNGTGGVPEDITQRVHIGLDDNNLDVRGTVPGYSFAFASIVSSDGLSIISTALVTNLPANVAKITLVFMPAGGPSCPAGGPPSPTTVYTDAFNMDIAEFSDCDEFVQVYDVAGGGTYNAALTTTANEDGMVATAQAESMRADNQVSDSHGTPKFDHWGIVGGSDSSVPNLNLAANDNYIAIAFFKSPQLPPCTSGGPVGPARCNSALQQILPCHGGIQLQLPPCRSGIQLQLPPCRSGIQSMPCHGGIQSVPCHGSAQIVPQCGSGPINNPDWTPQGDPSEKLKGKSMPRPLVKRTSRKR